MRDFLLKLGNIDRRVIYGIIAIGVIIPLLRPIGLPENITPPVKHLYDYIDSLPKGSVIILSIDYDATVLPEVHPMVLAVLRHAMVRGIKPIGLGLNPAGTGLGLDAFSKVGKELGKKYGIDFVYLGFKPNVSATILGLGEDIRKVFPTDYFGTPIDSIPMLKNVRNYNDIALTISFSGSSLPENWIMYANARYGEKIACGVTAVMAADFYPYLQTGQLIGMIAGLKGAAEYETLVNRLFRRLGLKKPSVIAIRGMDANSLAHVLIMIFIILGNLAYFSSKRGRKE